MAVFDQGQGRRVQEASEAQGVRPGSDRHPARRRADLTR